MIAYLGFDMEDEKDVRKYENAVLGDKYWKALREIYEIFSRRVAIEDREIFENILGKYSINVEGLFYNED